MKRKYLTRAVALLGVASLSLTGCSSFISEDVKSYPLASTMTSAELVDYYAQALKYDSIVSRNVDVHEAKYEMKDIEGAKSEKLKDLTSQCEAILGKNEYTPTEDSVKLVSNDTFNYIKGSLDNEVLTGGKVQNIQGALGYYFVDVKYDVTSKTPGTFKDVVNLIGLDGAFTKDYKDRYSINTAYLTTVVKQLNEYYYKNNINKCAVFDSNINTIKILDNTAPEYTDNIIDDYDSFEDSDSDTYTAPGDEGEQDDTLSDIGTDSSDSDEVTSDDSNESSDEYAVEPLSLDDETAGEVDNSKSKDKSSVKVKKATKSSDKSDADSKKSDKKSDKKSKKSTKKSATGSDALPDGSNYTIVTPESRRLQLDTKLINKTTGSSTTGIADMPELDDVYVKPSEEGTISGYGIYPAGDDGLKTFGFDRSKLSGSVTLRYVFKDDESGTGDILGSNIYIQSEEITNGVNVSSNNVLVPEFLRSQLEQIVERADRVQANNDLAGLMSGNVYEDIGVGVLRGYKSKNTGISKHMSTIRQIINRDTANNSYLLEVETTTIEGAKDVDSYGTYKDISYVVVQQQGDKFIITDWCRVSRTIAAEPPIDPESNVQKRLIALNLAGSISDDSKDSIKSLLSNLYTAGTNRLLRGPEEIKVDGETKTLEKGMYDCFASDTSILSADELEYENSLLRDILTKHGTDISSIYSGTVTEWIGGYEDQAEFTTEELVSYDGLNSGYYMQVYYLAQIVNDEWVIAERTVLDSYDVDDAEQLDAIKERVGQK